MYFPQLDTISYAGTELIGEEEEYAFSLNVIFHSRDGSKPKMTNAKLSGLLLNPPRLPRDHPNITLGAVYHPPQADNRQMNDHISHSLDTILTNHPSTAIIVAGDFNQLPKWTLKQSFKLKQIVNFSTRREATLDKIFTNISQYYDPPTKYSQIGKSDHFSVVMVPKSIIEYDKGKPTYKITRVMGKNEKVLFANAL